MAVPSDLVVEVIAKHWPRLAGEPVRLLAAGDFSTWDVGSRFILRFSLDDRGDNALEREAAALDVLAAALPVAVPRVAMLEPSGSGHLVMGYPKLPGVSGEEHRPRGEQRDAIADQLAGFLDALHGRQHDLPVVVPEWPMPDFEAQLADARRYRSLIEAQAGDVLTDLMRVYLDGHVPLPTTTATRVLCHADLKGEHVLLDAKDGRLHAVIDWADIACADPAADLGALAIWLGPSFVSDVARRYGASQADADRGLFGIRVWMLTGFGKMLAGENAWPRDLVSNQLRWAFGAFEPE